MRIYSGLRKCLAERWLVAVDFAVRKCICGRSDFNVVFNYHEPPKIEIRFQFSSGGHYRREVLKCNRCGHYISEHQMDPSQLYKGDYVDSNYGEKGIRATFDRINALPSSKSDNIGRV